MEAFSASAIYVQSDMNNTKGSETLADHDELFTRRRCSIDRASIVQDIIAGQYATAQTRLRREYQQCFDLEPSDWGFLTGIAAVRNAMPARTILTHGTDEQQDCIFTHLLKGHGPIRDLFGASIKKLLEAGLLRYPRISGEERQRIIHKPYYAITPEATDCIDEGLVGPNVGDLGESVAHAVGTRLYGEYMRRRFSQMGYEVWIEYYDDLLLDDHDIDVAVFVRESDDQNGRTLFSVGEVKTTLSSDQEAINSLVKMGAVRDCPSKHWIAPRRELINEIVNVAAAREWYSINRVPETLALETTHSSGTRGTNDRLEGSEFVADNVGTPLTTPLTKGFTYEMLYRELKEMEPSLFDAPPVTKARIRNRGSAD